MSFDPFIQGILTTFTAEFVVLIFGILYFGTRK